MLYALGDPHLSFGSNKPMDIFGEQWRDHTEKLRRGFSQLGPDDLCVLCGDISWSLSLEGAVEDFKFIDSLPGKKIILKGNHDYWWSTVSKIKALFEKHDIKTIDILHNNCFFYKDAAICGTRGWFYEEETGGEHDKKIMNRELMRLEASLKAAGDCPEKLCFLHYPPRYRNYRCAEIIEILKKYGVRECCYGHIHKYFSGGFIQGVEDGIEYRLVSADFVGFSPVKVKL